MKKKYRLHYKCVDGLKPTDRTRNWLCLTMIEPNKDITTLALDEDALENIMHQCKDNAHRDYIMGNIHARINRRIQEGHHEGSITVAV